MAVNPGTWVSLLTFLCFDSFGFLPETVLSRPLTFTLDILPPCFLLALMHGSLLVGAPPLVTYWLALDLVVGPFLWPPFPSSLVTSFYSV